ncbi:MAG TPA: 4-alpha-glucanotransferase [Myxococcales bacterium]|nr:4-alpha-glucanotransferase [Myxococcales bacterium]
MSDERELVRAALAALGIRRLALAVHDAALPGDPRDDAGRGAPLSHGGRSFLRFAAELGFHALQLGPQGETTEHDQSPYDAAIFSRSTISLALLPLAEAGLVSQETVGSAVRGRPAGWEKRAAHRYAHAVARRALDEAFAAFEARQPSDLVERLAEFTERNRPWLERDALYAALAAEHQEDDWLRWPEHDRTLWEALPGGDAAQRARRARVAQKRTRLLDRFAFAQFLAHEQHAAFHEEARELGLLLYGDLQIGLSHQDVWAYGALLLSAFRMGAPPSRTNPSGQPWNYAVLDPGQYEGAVLDLVRSRMSKMLDEFDGLRIDHPHGLIDPWVYPAAQPDPQLAVQRGARLFSSPDVPELAGFAIARDGQLDRTLPRHADGWVRDLSDDQVDRYGRIFDVVVDAARTRGRQLDDLLCEVLSTQPYPVERVLARHGLGRFRVTQKVVLDDPADVYRSENAAPMDWIMAGTHDTRPVWRAAEHWISSGKAGAHAAYLARRLIPDERDREAWQREVEIDPHRLATAKLADLFVGPARNVMVFFTDLFGMRDIYNVPGTISEENWSLRIPGDFAARYARARREGRALHLPRALATAIRARGADFTSAHRDLLLKLEERSATPPANA